MFSDPSVRDDFPSAKSFREYFGKWSNFGGFPRYIGPKNEEEYQALIKANSISISREDALGTKAIQEVGSARIHGRVPLRYLPGYGAG